MQQIVVALQNFPTFRLNLTFYDMHLSEFY